MWLKSLNIDFLVIDV